MIRVLHITRTAKIAGAENLLLEIAKKYDRENFYMEFCTISGRGDFHGQLDKLGAVSYALGMRSFIEVPLIFLNLVGLLRKKKYDVLHVHLFLSSFLGLLAGLVAKVPVKIMTRHYSDYMYLYGNPFKVRIDRLSLRLCDKVTVVSEAVGRVIIERDHFDCGKLITVYNGIDLDKFKPVLSSSEKIKRELGFEGVLIVGAVGSLEYRKGHSFLIEAAQHVIESVPKVHFIVAGEGPLLNTLKAKTSSMGISGNFSFIGYRSDISEVISSFDVFVHPSTEEGFGIAILEALAMGKPVVAFSVGGIPEIIQDCSYARLVTPGDCKGLADAILSFLPINLDQEKLRTEARKSVSEKFAVLDMIRKYESLYKNLISDVSKRKGI